MILSACSSYFQTLFMENTCEHPIVFLKDIKISEVRAILDYMYKGEVNVAQEELPGTCLVFHLLFVFFFFTNKNEKSVLSIIIFFSEICFSPSFILAVRVFAHLYDFRRPILEKIAAAVDWYKIAPFTRTIYYLLT